MKRINVNLHPHGGFAFTETDGTSIVGQTWDGVIARVQSYRKRNNLPPGNPKEEVMEQACKKNPGICTDESELAKAQLKVATLKGRMLTWMAHIRQAKNKTGIGFVSPEEATRRADICKRCPMKKEISEGCSSCRAAMVALRREILGDGRAVDPALVQNGCLVLGSDLSTAVHLDQTVTNHSELPAECWRKKLV